MLTVTLNQARQFILLRQGLLGEHRFIGKSGAYQYIRQAGCIQFDPVDVCGRNADLTLQSRVKGITRETLSDLLYRDRLLVDYTDKELSIWPSEDWPYFSSYRERSIEHGKQFTGIPELEEKAVAYIREHGAVSSDTLPLDGTIFWHSSMHWSGHWDRDSLAARSVLEQLYTDGVLLIHHKTGSRKYYDLAEKLLPEELLSAPNPCPDKASWLCWRVKRRIGAVGLLWNRSSTAWLGISMSTEQRNAAFDQLEKDILARKVNSTDCYYRLRKILGNYHVAIDLARPSTKGAFRNPRKHSVCLCLSSYYDDLYDCLYYLIYLPTLPKDA